MVFRSRDQGYFSFLLLEESHSGPVSLPGALQHCPVTQSSLLPTGCHCLLKPSLAPQAVGGASF